MVSLIFCGDLKYCPYIQRYTERLEEREIDYHIVFWNRAGETLHLPGNYFYYDRKSELLQNKLNKLKEFAEYKNWVVRYIDRQKPDKCILLSSLTGFLMGSYLIRKSIPYIFDIRDYSYEEFLPFYEIEKNIIRHSVFTAISSKGFKQFLPQNYEYVIAHNFNRNDIQNDESFIRKTGSIRIVWNGMIRYFDFQKQLLMELGNDDRFELIYHGDGPELYKYQQFCRENKLSNVYCTGRYNNRDKTELLKDADMINNVYGYVRNAGKKLKYAVSNRFYDGLIYHIPQIVEPDGYKCELVQTMGVGISATFDGKLGDRLCDYYQSIIENDFDRRCDEALQRIIKEDDLYLTAIDQFLS